MNAQSPHGEGFGTRGSADRAEAARLLPAPAHPDLLDDRLRVLKEHLMSEIHQTAPEAGPGAAAADTAPAPRHRRRRWVLAVAPLAAAAVAAAVITAPGHRGRHTDTAEPAPSEAALLLQDAAAVVSRAPAVPVGHDQFVFIRSEASGRTNPAKPAGMDKQGNVRWEYSEVAQKMSKLSSVREWIPWSQGQAGAQAISDDAPVRLNLPAPGHGLVGSIGHWQTPLENLAALPHDPAEALRTIEAQVRGQFGNSPKRGKDPAVAPSLLFEYLGGMFEESVDPQTTAFLYRVAARIPGTTVVPDAMDAAGRHGVAISVDGTHRDRLEWIFDKSTYTFLGLREVTRDDTVIGPAGSVITVTAVLGRTVVDHLPDMSAKITG